MSLGVRAWKFICVAITLSDSLAEFCFLSQQNLGSARLGVLPPPASDTYIVGLVLLAGDTVRVPLALKAAIPTVTLSPHASGPASKERSYHPGRSNLPQLL